MKKIIFLKRCALTIFTASSCLMLGSLQSQLVDPEVLATDISDADQAALDLADAVDAFDSCEDPETCTDAAFNVIDAFDALVGAEQVLEDDLNDATTDAGDCAPACDQANQNLEDVTTAVDVATANIDDFQQAVDDAQNFLDNQTVEDFVGADLSSLLFDLEDQATTTLGPVINEDQYVQFDIVGDNIDVDNLLILQDAQETEEPGEPESGAEGAGLAEEQVEEGEEPSEHDVALSDLGDELTSIDRDAERSDEQTQANLDRLAYTIQVLTDSQNYSTGLQQYASIISSGLIEQANAAALQAQLTGADQTLASQRTAAAQAQVSSTRAQSTLNSSQNSIIKTFEKTLTTIP